MDRVILSLAFSVKQSTSRGAVGKIVLVNTIGGGNIGDQALFEAFTANTPGDIISIEFAAGAFSVPRDVAGRLSTVVLSKLLRKSSPTRTLEVAKLGALLASAREVNVIGADIMDGGYDPWLSTVMWNIASTAKARGITARILGFSWNGSPDPLTLKAARIAHRHGVELLARDPISRERLLESGFTDTEQTADIVFQLGEDDRSTKYRRIMDDWASQGYRVALVNISQLISDSEEGINGHLKVVKHLLNRNVRVLLVPHVDRGSASDVEMNRRFLNRIGATDGLAAVEGLLSPLEIKGLTSAANLVVTGRMHLSVFALSSGVPAIVLSSQGKVAGLMQLFGHSDWCVDSGQNFEDRIIALVDAVLDDEGEIRAGIRSSLVTVSRLALRNFDRQTQIPKGQTRMSDTAA